MDQRETYELAASVAAQLDDAGRQEFAALLDELRKDRPSQLGAWWWLRDAGWTKRG